MDRRDRGRQSLTEALRPSTASSEKLPARMEPPHLVPDPGGSAAAGGPSRHAPGRVSARVRGHDETTLVRPRLRASLKSRVHDPVRIRFGGDGATGGGWAADTEAGLVHRA